MPFSRSRSMESMTRSATTSLVRKAPDCTRRASTRVVLPWSTCAITATFRRSRRLATGKRYGASVSTTRNPYTDETAHRSRGPKVGRYQEDYRKLERLPWLAKTKVGGPRRLPPPRPLKRSDRQRGTRSLRYNDETPTAVGGGIARSGGLRLGLGVDDLND